MVERRHSPLLQGRRFLSTFPVCITIVCQVGVVFWGPVLMEFCSAVLEGASQVHAREIPRRLAKGRLYSVQSR